MNCNSMIVPVYFFERDTSVCEGRIIWIFITQLSTTVSHTVWFNCFVTGWNSHNSKSSPGCWYKRRTLHRLTYLQHKSVEGLLINAIHLISQCKSKLYQSYQMLPRLTKLGYAFESGVYIKRKRIYSVRIVLQINIIVYTILLVRSLWSGQVESIV